MCVSLAEFEDGGLGLFLGKVHKRNEDDRTCDVTEYRCTKDPWTEDCVKSKWYPKQPKTSQTVENRNVIIYFKQMTKGNLFPAPVKDGTVCVIDVTLFTSHTS